LDHLFFVFPILVVRSSFKWFAGATNAYFNSIKALINALDASHPYTQGHSKRVAQNAVKVAHALRLSDGEVEKIEQGAVLHDIGKIGLDKAILDKAGPLNSFEWAKVKRHPILGSSIVQDLSFLQKSTNIILHHHERIDGRGYPAGLSGNDIPVGARIVNVVDALDALTSDRSYRKALSVEEAIHILQGNSDTQFDSEIVNIVENLFRQGLLVFQDETVQDDREEFLFTMVEIDTIFSQQDNIM
jgi:putative nucleotidyltransferase with HDIG domain